MPFVGVFFLLASFLIVTASVVASQESFPRIENLDLISRQTNASLNRILKRAYIGYLGLDQSHQYSEMSTFSAESMFDDLNWYLQKEVEPLLKKGKQLSQVHLRHVGDRTYLDQFILQEFRLKGLMFSNSERYEEAHRNLEKAAELAEKSGDIKALIHILNNLSYCEFHLQKISKAIQNQERAVELSRVIGESEILGRSLYNLGWIYLNSGQLESAVPLLQQAVQSSEFAHHPVQEAVALISLGAIQLYQGHLIEAGQNLAHSLKLSREINSFRYRAMAAYNYALVLAGEGQFSAAAQLLEEVLSILENHGKQVFMRGEKELIERRATGLFQWLSERTPEKIGSGSFQSLDIPFAKMSESSKLHSHFSHLVNTFTSSKIPPPLFSITEEPPEKVTVRLTMQEAESHPKGVFTMPVHLKTFETIEFHQLVFRMSYPKELSLTGVQKGFVLRADEVTVNSKTVPDTSNNALRVTSITVNGGQISGEKQSFSDGLILYLEFKVADKVGARVLDLKNQLLRAVTIDGRLIAGGQLWAEDQTVYILRPDMIPISPCFFYIH